MEAKWREYGKAKVATDKRKKEEAARKRMEEMLQKEADMRSGTQDDDESEGQLKSTVEKLIPDDVSHLSEADSSSFFLPETKSIFRFIPHLFRSCSRAEAVLSQPPWPRLESFIIVQSQMC